MRTFLYFIFGGLLCSVGLVVGAVTMYDSADSCRQAFELSEKARLIAVDSLGAATDGMKASGRDDAVGLIDAATRLQTAQDQLEAMKPEYDRATQACKGNSK